MMDGDGKENRASEVQRQFSKNAEDYRDSPLFAQGDDLRRMVESVELGGNERLLDVGTGSGHTVLAFAPFIERGTGIDLTDEMVRVAARFAQQKGTANVEFCQGNVEKLPFADESFNIVTCRFAAHHFPDMEKALSEISRVLKKDGIFILVDHYAPEEKLLDRFVNVLDRTRDASHVRENTLPEYERWFDSRQLSYREVLKWDLPIDFEDWVNRARTSKERRTELTEQLRSAPESCKKTFQIQLNEDGTPRSFCLKCAMLHGVKK